MEHDKFKEVLSGFSVTTTTPFTDDLTQIDTDAISTNIEFLTKHDVPLIIPNGNTGEFYSLSEREWEIVLRAVMDASTAYLKLVNAPSLQSTLKIVMPGYPNESYLFHKISGTHLQVGGSGTRMPSVTPLSEANIGLISQWISQGALDN